MIRAYLVYTFLVQARRAHPSIPVVSILAINGQEIDVGVPFMAAKTTG